MAEEKKIKINIEDNSADESEAAEMELETPGENDEGASPEPAEETAVTVEEQLQESLDTALADAEENRDKYVRAAAELENFKKRTSREMDDLRKYANEALLRELLPVIDNLERAISITTDGDEKTVQTVVEGVDLTRKEIIKVLDRFHVKPIESMHQPFDPNFHQAVSREENDSYPENTVLREFQKGYLIYDRLLRPAMVVVTMSAAEEKRNKPNKKLNRYIVYI